MNSGGATNALSHFECDPFDLLGNAPYSNPPKSSPEKGEKSRREQQIFDCRKQWIFDDGSLENQWLLPKCLLDFEGSETLKTALYLRTASYKSIPKIVYLMDFLIYLFISSNKPYTRLFWKTGHHLGTIAQS